MIGSLGYCECEFCKAPYGSEIYCPSLIDDPTMRICDRCLIEKCKGIKIAYKHDIYRVMEMELIKQKSKKWYQFWG